MFRLDWKWGQKRLQNENEFDLEIIQCLGLLRTLLWALLSLSANLDVLSFAHFRVNLTIFGFLLVSPFYVTFSLVHSICLAYRFTESFGSKLTTKIMQTSRGTSLVQEFFQEKHQGQILKENDLENIGE